MPFSSCQALWVSDFRSRPSGTMGTFPISGRQFFSSTPQKHPTVTRPTWKTQLVDLLLSLRFFVNNLWFLLNSLWFRPKITSFSLLLSRSPACLDQRFAGLSSKTVFSQVPSACHVEPYKRQQTNMTAGQKYQVIKNSVW